MLAILYKTLTDPKLSLRQKLSISGWIIQLWHCVWRVKVDGRFILKHGTADQIRIIGQALKSSGFKMGSERVVDLADEMINNAEGIVESRSEQGAA